MCVWQHNIFCGIWLLDKKASFKRLHNSLNLWMQIHTLYLAICLWLLTTQLCKIYIYGYDAMMYSSSHAYSYCSLTPTHRPPLTVAPLSLTPLFSPIHKIPAVVSTLFLSHLLRSTPLYPFFALTFPPLIPCLPLCVSGLSAQPPRWAEPALPSFAWRLADIFLKWSGLAQCRLVSLGWTLELLGKTKSLWSAKKNSESGMAAHGITPSSHLFTVPQQHIYNKAEAVKESV